MNMTTYGYIRSSKGLDTASYKTQTESIERFALEKGWELERVWSERSVSGELGLDLRPAGKVLLKRLKSGDRIIVESFDRLFRSPIDARNQLRRLTKKGVQIWLAKTGRELTATEDFDLMSEIMDAFAVSEAALVGNRIREVKARLREAGKFQGGKVEFGFKLNADGTVTKDPDSQEALELMRALRKEGQSYREISEAVHKKFKKLSISHEGVRRILNRK
jgi:DNA invertase Pin-like site-specific DNA recombinase